jgi:hypothetical protein
MRFNIFLLWGAIVSFPSFAQFGLTQSQRDSLNKLTNIDYENMKQQLGIKKLRSGPSGNENAPNHANYDEKLANPCINLPEILTLKSGKKVTEPKTWWQARRPELIEEFEREVYGRLPAEIPEVKWSVKAIDYEQVGRTPVVAKQVIGKVDNQRFPSIHVEINMILVLPTNVKGPVPVLMMFGRPTFPAPSQPTPEQMDKINTAFKEMIIKDNPELKTIFDQHPAYTPITRLPGVGFNPPATTGDSPGNEQLLAAGWGTVP